MIYEPLVRCIMVGIMKKSRIAAGIASLILAAFALGGFAAWAVADAYFISGEPQFSLLFATSIVLLLLAAYWGIFASTGYARFSTRCNVIILVASMLIGVPACIFVMAFW